MSTVQLHPLARPAYIVNQWYQAAPGPKSAGVVIPTAEIHLLPFYVGRPITISTLSARVTTFATSGNFQMAIYANNPLTNEPTGAPLGVTGSASTTGVGMKDTDITGADITLIEGWYWMAINVDATAGGTAIFQTVAPDESFASYFFGAATSLLCSGGGTVSALHLSTPSAFGTWGDLTGATFTRLSTTASASLLFKVSAVP